MVEVTGWTSETLNRWRVVEVSRSTGRVLRVLERDLRSPREAALWAEGWGKPDSPKRRVTWERQP